MIVYLVISQNGRVVAVFDNESAATSYAVQRGSSHHVIMRDVYHTVREAQ